MAGTAAGSVIVQSGILRKHSIQSKDVAGAQSLVDIAIDGSVAEHYPGFENYMRDALKAIPQIGEIIESRISIGQAKDGSSVGAAIVALVVAQQTTTVSVRGLYTL